MGFCSLAKVHLPIQPAPDDHHVIPQAWQRHWHPPSTSSFWAGWEQPAMMELTGPPHIAALWDHRTIVVCPNHHRLVHEAIVALMRAGKGSEDPLDAKAAAFGQGRLTRAQEAGFLGLCRWKEAGGSLEALRAAGLWGEQ